MTYPIANLGKNNRPHYKPKTSYGWYRCSGCERFLPRSQFHRRVNVPCGISSICKECDCRRYRRRLQKKGKPVGPWSPPGQLSSRGADPACPFVAMAAKGFHDHGI